MDARLGESVVASRPPTRAAIRAGRTKVGVIDASAALATRIAPNRYARRDRIRRFLIVPAASAALACVTAGGQPPVRAPLPNELVQPRDFVVTGLTSPVQSATIAAVMPARIAEIPFPEGAHVEAGDVIVILDDAVQAARTEMARLAADSTLHVEIARVRRDDAVREWERIQRIGGRDLASSNEVAKSQATAEAARLDYEIKRLEVQQAVQAYERERRLLDEYRIRAPFAGYVVAHLKQPGETVDELDGVIQLTALEPLRVDLDCPIALAPSIRNGVRYDVRPVDAQWPPRVGVVTFVSRVADGASQTFKVRLEVPNADERWLAGLKVAVDFTHGPLIDAPPAVLTRDRAQGASEGRVVPR